MKHNTRKLVSFLASRHQVKQVTSWSAFLAAVDAAWPAPQPKAPHWHGHTAKFPGAGEITPVWTSLREMLRTFFLILLSIFTTGYCPCPPPLLILRPSPVSPMALAGRYESGLQDAEGQFWQPWCFQATNMYLLTWIFLFMAFKGACCYTCKLISSRRRKSNTSLRKTKAVIHTAVPVTRLRESASTQVQNSDPQNLAEQVQSLTCASAWPKSSPVPQKLVPSFRWPLHKRLPTSLQQDLGWPDHPPRGALKHIPVQGFQPYTHVERGWMFMWEPFLQEAAGKGT